MQTAVTSHASNSCKLRNDCQVYFTLSTAKQNDINDKNTQWTHHYKQITVVMAKQDNIVLYSLSIYQWTFPKGCPNWTLCPGSTRNLKFLGASNSSTIEEPRMKYPTLSPLLRGRPVSLAPSCFSVNWPIWKRPFSFVLSSCDIKIGNTLDHTSNPCGFYFSYLHHKLTN